MSKDLLLNHYSIRDDGTLSDSEESGKAIMMKFFETIRTAVNSEDFEQYYVSDLNFWEVSITPELSLGEFLSSLTPKQKEWIYQLRKLTQVTTDNFFPLELLEQVIEYTPRITANNVCVDSLGCIACMEDTVSVSFSTGTEWNECKIFITWYDATGEVDSIQHGLNDFFYNISEPGHVQEVLAFFPEDYGPVTHDKWLSALSTTEPTELFWEWFNALTESSKKSLFSKTKDVQERNWHARYKTSFQQLGDGVCEIRCDLRGGGTVRVYVKVITPSRVILLFGSDKSGQEEAIKTAKKMARDLN